MSRQHHSRVISLPVVSRAREQNVAKQKTTSDKLRYLSHYDGLTRLPNRTFFRNKLKKALKSATDYDDQLAVLLLSIDSYSRINETLGPAMGDRLVRCVAKRLKDLTGNLLVELACALIRLRSCLKPSVTVFCVTSLSCYTWDRNSMGDNPVFFLKTELK